MHCQFLNHGLALSYDQVVKPCCLWNYDSAWSKNNKLGQTDLQNWHQSAQVIAIRNELEQGQWPKHCSACQEVEAHGRGDSIRGNGNQAYQHYAKNDITLEIRPGSVCNFACQTCWPEASSRVAQYYHQANLIDIKNIDSHEYKNFDFLLPVAPRIKDVIVLGGEPFFDKDCLNFLDWASQHLRSKITLFTNGSQVRWDWIHNYKDPIVMVFSLDATNRQAEYIRFGTDWNTVVKNFERARQIAHVEARVNITVSVYNYHYVGNLIEYLLQDWPSVVSFGTAWQDHLQECVVPLAHRPAIIDSLLKTIQKLESSTVEFNQRQNAINALLATVNNLTQVDFDPVLFEKFQQFVTSMDQVKKINIHNYCPEVSEYFSCD